MLYLKAAEIVEALKEHDGREGKFIKTFAINDKRNKNGWRVTWDSIKKHIASFLNQPGIEYVKCEGSLCDLDHTEGATFEQSLAVQEAYRVTSIIDFQLDETNHTAYFIHEVHDADFYEKVEKGEIKYVSPSIWPLPGGYDILGQQENGLPVVDAHNWKGLHDAFVNKPAFGDEAEVTATCEGEGCMLRLLTAAEMKYSDDPLAPIKTVPILVRHKNKLTFVSVTQEEYNKIKELEKITESEILPILRASSSFHSCACSSLHTMNEEERRQMDALKAELEKEKDEKKELVAKLAKVTKAKEAEDEDKDKEKDKGASAAKSAKVADTPEYKALQARVEMIEKDASAPLVAKMVEMREAAGASDEDIQAFKASLAGKGYETIKAQHDSEAIYHSALKARAEDRVHLPFPDSSDLGPLSAKSLEEIDQEVP